MFHMNYEIPYCSIANAHESRLEISKYYVICARIFVANFCASVV